MNVNIPEVQCPIIVDELKRSQSINSVTDTNDLQMVNLTLWVLFKFEIIARTRDSNKSVTSVCFCPSGTRCAWVSWRGKTQSSYERREKRCPDISARRDQGMP